MRTLSLGLAIVFAFAGAAAAQLYRSRQVTPVVTFGAGGPADTLTGWWPLINAANIKAE